MIATSEAGISSNLPFQATDLKKGSIAPKAAPKEGYQPVIIISSRNRKIILTDYYLNLAKTTLDKLYQSHWTDPLHEYLLAAVSPFHSHSEKYEKQRKILRKICDDIHDDGLLQLKELFLNSKSLQVDNFKKRMWSLLMRSSSFTESTSTIDECLMIIQGRLEKLEHDAIGGKEFQRKMERKVEQ